MLAFVWQRYCAANSCQKCTDTQLVSVLNPIQSCRQNKNSADTFLKMIKTTTGVHHLTISSLLNNAFSVI